MITQADLQYLNGVAIHTPDGTRIGSAGQVYLDDRTGEPEWVSIHTGDAGESFVPVGAAVLTGDRLEIPYAPAQIAAAPQIDADHDLTPADEDELNAYYGLRRTGQLRKYTVSDETSSEFRG